MGRERERAGDSVIINNWTALTAEEEEKLADIFRTICTRERRERIG